MNGAFGHESALLRLYWAGTIWDNGMNIMNHAPGAGLIVDLLASSPTRYHCTTDALDINKETLHTNCFKLFVCCLFLQGLYVTGSVGQHT